MQVVCAWCGTTLSGQAGPVSHGICSSCSLTIERAYHRSLREERRGPSIHKRRAVRGLTRPLPGFGG